MNIVKLVECWRKGSEAASHRASFC